jgi:ribonuclease Z
MNRPRCARTRPGVNLNVKPWLAFCAIAICFGLLGCDALVDRMISRAVDQQLSAGPIAWLEDDAMNVVICGAGSPLADAARASACTAVIAGGKMYLVDVGPGSTENSMLWQLPLADLDGIFLTHFHSDHIGELGEAITQSWIAGRETPLNVYGPEGIDKVVSGFQLAYSHDLRYRVDHHGEKYLPADGAKARAVVTPMLSGKGREILNSAGLVVTVFAVDHTPVEPAVGFRFDYKGRSVVISGDTAPSPNVELNAKGADVLIHEALEGAIIGRVSEALAEAGVDRLAKLSHDILDYHTTPADAVAAGRAAGVQIVVLSHLVPAVPPALQNFVFLRDVDDGGEVDVIVASDGMHLRLPVGSDEIEIDELE